MILYQGTRGNRIARVVDLAHAIQVVQSRHLYAKVTASNSGEIITAVWAGRGSVTYRLYSYPAQMVSAGR